MKFTLSHFLSFGFMSQYKWVTGDFPSDMQDLQFGLDFWLDIFQLFIFLAQDVLPLYRAFLSPFEFGPYPTNIYLFKVAIEKGAKYVQS